MFKSAQTMCMSCHFSTRALCCMRKANNTDVASMSTSQSCGAYLDLQASKLCKFLLKLPFKPCTLTGGRLYIEKGKEKHGLILALSEHSTMAFQVHKACKAVEVQH